MLDFMRDTVGQRTECLGSGAGRRTRGAAGGSGARRAKAGPGRDRSGRRFASSVASHGGSPPRHSPSIHARCCALSKTAKPRPAILSSDRPNRIRTHGVFLVFPCIFSHESLNFVLILHSIATHPKYSTACFPYFLCFSFRFVPIDHCTLLAVLQAVRYRCESC